MKAIINAVLVMPDHYIPDATLLIEDGKIIDFGKKIEVPKNAEIIDANREFNIDKRDLILKEDVKLAVTSDGYIKRSSFKSYKSRAW